jgi:transcriptional regulator with XRE-family HTH domain
MAGGDVEPVVLRYRLGRRLRQLRRAQGLTQYQVADAMHCSHTKVVRMETAATRACFISQLG